MIDLKLCACMGPKHGEPYCYCEMVRRGLPLNELARQADEARMREQLKNLFGWPDQAAPPTTKT